jgi:hypothetical protein
MDELLTSIYSGQDGGQYMPYFTGKQYGGGWLRNIARFAFPLIKKAVTTLTNTAGKMIKDPDAKLFPTLMNEGVKAISNNNSTINRGRKRQKPNKKPYTVKSNKI